MQETFGVVDYRSPEEIRVTFYSDKHSKVYSAHLNTKIFPGSIVRIQDLSSPVLMPFYEYTVSKRIAKIVKGQLVTTDKDEKLARLMFVNEIQENDLVAIFVTYQNDIIFASKYAIQQQTNLQQHSTAFPVSRAFTKGILRQEFEFMKDLGKFCCYRAVWVALVEQSLRKTADSSHIKAFINYMKSTSHPQSYNLQKCLEILHVFYKMKSECRDNALENSQSFLNDLETDRIMCEALKNHCSASLDISSSNTYQTFKILSTILNINIHVYSFDQGLFYTLQEINHHTNVYLALDENTMYCLYTTEQTIIDCFDIQTQTINLDFSYQRPKISVPKEEPVPEVEIMSDDDGFLEYNQNENGKEEKFVCEICFKFADTRLDCDHSFCKKDLINYLRLVTNENLQLLVDMEIKNFKPNCPLCELRLEQSFIDEIMSEQLAIYRDIPIYEEEKNPIHREEESLISKNKGNPTNENLFKPIHFEEEEAKYNPNAKICSLCNRPSLSPYHLTTCPHIICANCLTTHLFECSSKNQKSSCPVCKVPLNPKQSHVILKNNRCYNESCSFSICHPPSKAVNKNYARCIRCSFPISNGLSKSLCGCRICDRCFRSLKKENNSTCFECGEFIAQTGRISISKIPKECPICHIQKRPEQMILLNCLHGFCDTCFTQYINVSIQSSTVDINCPSCPTRIPRSVLEGLMSRQDLDKFELLQIRKQYEIIACPNCKTEREVSIEPTENNIECFRCGYIFCRKCFESYHNGNCETTKIDQQIDELEAEGIEISVCPNCHTVSAKEGGCDHVVCPKLSCRTEYCFYCSCKRIPTLAHGNHYHRPQCRFFALPKILSDSFSNKCSECVINSRLCARPLDLLTPRRFLPGEF